MVEEVRSALVEHLESLSLLDSWSKIIAKIKTRNTQIYSFYPMVLSHPGNLLAYVKKVSVTLATGSVRYMRYDSTKGRHRMAWTCVSGSVFGYNTQLNVIHFIFVDK